LVDADIAVMLTSTIILEGTTMTNRVGNKNQAQLRGKQERKEIKQGNREREAIRRATAQAKYRNAVKGQPQIATA
jgi:hypothetical protein